MTPFSIEVSAAPDRAGEFRAVLKSEQGQVQEIYEARPRVLLAMLVDNLVTALVNVA